MSFTDFDKTVRRGDPTESLMVANVETVGLIDYVGQVSPSGAWCIIKVDSTTGVVVTYAWGATDYDTAWAGRAGLTYEPPHIG